MQLESSQNPLSQGPNKRRGLDGSAALTFSNAEQRVLEHAADILGVPVRVLLALNRPFSEIVCEKTRPQTEISTPTVNSTTTVQPGPQPPGASQASGTDFPISSAASLSTEVQHAIPPSIEVVTQDSLDMIGSTSQGEVASNLGPITDGNFSDVAITDEDIALLFPDFFYNGTPSMALPVIGNSVPEAQTVSASDLMIGDISEPNLYRHRFWKLSNEHIFIASQAYHYTEQCGQ